MNTFDAKTYGAIYVYDPENIQKVKDVIRDMDDLEFEYLPDELIKPFSDYPNVSYTYKFDDLDLDALTAKCWSKGILIWIFKSGNEKYPESALKKLKYFKD